MKAKIKCSSCGSEIDNLNFSWGKKYWLFIIPVMLLGFYPLIKMTLLKADPLKDMTISQVETKSGEDTIEVIGLITNDGRNRWSNVTVEVEFFDSDGKFLDERSEHLQSTIRPDAMEHFKVAIADASPEMIADGVEMKVKISGGLSMPF